MGFLRQGELGPAFLPYSELCAHYGFLPNVFRAQSLLPRAIEAEAELIRAVLANPGAVSRRERESIVLAVAAALGNAYWTAVEWRVLQERHQGSPLQDFAVKLSCQPDQVRRTDLDALRTLGLGDQHILEVVLTAALSRFLCIVAAGLGPEPDFEPPPLPRRSAASPTRAANGPDTPRPYLSLPAPDCPPLAFFRTNFGFIPELMAAQAARPDLVQAQVGLIRAILAPTDVLGRLQKEPLFIAVAAENLSTYCVTVHCEMLRGFGVSLEDSEQIAVGHHYAPLPDKDKALLDFALKLRRLDGFGRPDVEALRAHGFTEEQILEAVLMTAETTFFNTVAIGLGTLPDFEPRRVYRSQDVHLFPLARRPMDMGRAAGEDPDAEWVARVQGGDVDAFEELVRRYQRRIYRTLMGILGEAGDAQDAMQDAFLKAFQHIGEFQGRSRFSTWLMTIASNTGLQRLRERKPLESLDDSGENESFRPRQVQAWGENPEQEYSAAEMRRLVEKGVMKLPAKYRVVVMLRDIEQLSTEEAAAALKLTVPGLKARLFRGRCMLREMLAPHFAQHERGAAR